jgi:protein SCO1/2
MTQLNHSSDTTSLNVPSTRRVSPTISTRRIAWAGTVLILLLGALLVGWWNLPPTLHGIVLESPRVAEDFTLPASTGEEMSLSDFRGKYVVVFFGYTYCPDVCPMTLNELQQMVKTLGAKRAEEVQVLMVSVDPERDTPEQLATYLDYFNPSFVGMTGTVADIQPVASQFGIYFERQSASENTGYLVDHTSAITVIDPQGHVRMIFTNGTKGADMAADLAYLIRRG